MRPPTDRVSVLVRVGLALDCGAAATLAWLESEGDPPVYEAVHSSLAILAGVLLVLSVVIPKRLPRLAFDPALTLTAIVLLAHAFYVAIGNEHRGGQSVEVALFAFGGGVTALSQMIARQNEIRRERERVA